MKKTNKNFQTEGVKVQTTFNLEQK